MMDTCKTISTLIYYAGNVELVDNGWFVDLVLFINWFKKNFEPTWNVLVKLEFKEGVFFIP